MIRTLWHLSHSRRFALVLAASLFTLLGAARAALPGQRDFATAADAATALVDAARAGDQKAVLAVLGRTAQNLIVSGDPVQDRNALARLVTAYDAKHNLEALGQDRMDLVVGQDDWPLPIPIVQRAGRWHFDSAAGAEELVNRRIGKNELMTIKTLLACAAAQQDYFERFKAGTGAGAYAQRILSAPGRTDGLYWEVEPGQSPSPLGPITDIFAAF
jgi:hypothetical protein